MLPFDDRNIVAAFSTSHFDKDEEHEVVDIMIAVEEVPDGGQYKTVMIKFDQNMMFHHDPLYDDIESAKQRAAMLFATEILKWTALPGQRIVVSLENMP